jgi:radical SAM protein with 4Fe4S-binding SPASM domain
MPLLLQLKREILDPSGVQLFLGNNIGYFGPLERALRYGGENGHQWSGCMAGRAALGLEADGTLKGCPSLPTEAYGAGSVRDMPIETMWRESARIKELGTRTRADLWGFCATCDHADRCLAGCTWTAHALFGRPGNNPFCHHRALSLAAAGKRERITIVERAPGRPFDYGRFELVEEPIETALPDEEVDAAMTLGQLLGDGRSGMWSEKALAEIAAKAAPPRGDGS